MNFIFLMDPLHTIKMKKDTTFALMLEAYQREHRVYFVPDGGIILKNNKVYFETISVIPQLVEEKPFLEKENAQLSQDDVNVVFVRTDPPFNEKYLMHTWLLDRLPQRIPVINNPTGIRTVNEKIWATQFSSIIPKTFIGRQKKDIASFYAQQKDIIAKPTNAYGGSSVFHLAQGDKNANVAFETLSQNWTKDIILQQYVPAAQKGDKRILLLDGEPLGAVLRVHAKDDHRNNFFAGGTPQSTVINASDKKIINILKPHLKRLGLYFVGIDIIGNYLIEVNVTSPTCLQEMNRLYGKKLEKKIIDFAEKLVKDK